MPVNSKLSRPSTRSRREITFAMTGGDARPAPGSAQCISNILVCTRIHIVEDANSGFILKKKGSSIGRWKLRPL
ncbi:hypothetical protein K525DRAFT_255649, partial [Schizophyllum commune Loenen D]